MKKRKVIYLILIGLLASFVLFLYNAFNGNPISKFASKKVLESHLTTNYPDKEFRIKEGFYDFKFSEYHFTAIQIGTAQEFDFQLRGHLRPRVNGDGVRTANLDYPLMERLSAEAAAEITALLETEITNIRGVEVQLEVLKEATNSKVKWDKDFPFDKPIYLHIVLDSENDTKEDLLLQAQKIQQLLNEANYHYERVNINGGVYGEVIKTKEDLGYLKYAVAFTHDSEIKLDDIEVFNE